MKKIILVALVILIPSIALSEQFIDPSAFVSSLDKSFDEHLYFEKMEDAEKFETLTYIVSKRKKNNDLELMTMLVYYSKIIGNKNGATFLYHTFNEQYNTLIRQAHCTGKIDSKRLPSVVFFIRSLGNCFVIPYKDKHELTELFQVMSSILMEAKNDKRAQNKIYQMKVIATVRTLSDKYNIPPDVSSTLTDFFQGGLKKVFEPAK